MQDCCSTLYLLLYVFISSTVIIIGINFCFLFIQYSVPIISNQSIHNYRSLARSKGLVTITCYMLLNEYVPVWIITVPLFPLVGKYDECIPTVVCFVSSRTPDADMEHVIAIIFSIFYGCRLDCVRSPFTQTTRMILQHCYILIEI